MVTAIVITTTVGRPVKANAFNILESVPATFSESIVVMDADTGIVLYDKQGEIPYMPASTTKVMTAILAMENLDLEQLVTVGPKPPFAEGASMGFKEGEVVMVKDLIYSLLLQSANDAAEILAEEISGSKEEFALLMTNKAKEIGCQNTIFMNPSGLHVEGANNYTTAKDLALITAYASKFEQIIEMGQVMSYMLPLTNLLTDKNRWVSNKNDLFKKNSESYYEYITLAKTGWTPSAGYAHTALGEKDGKRIIVSILKGVNQKTYWQETKELMEWAFENVNVYPLYKRGQVIKKATLKDGNETTLVARDDFYYVSTTTEKPISMLEFSNTTVERSYKSGDIIDVAKILIKDKEIGTLDLICEKDIVLLDENTPVDPDSNVKVPSSTGLKKSLMMGFSVVSVLLILMFSIRIYNISKRKKRRSLSKRRVQALKRSEHDRYRH